MALSAITSAVVYQAGNLMAKGKSDFRDRHRKKDFARVTAYFSAHPLRFFCQSH